MNYKQEFRNLSLPTIALTAALAIAIVFALAVSALTQSTVPPTARQAAADPAFASRMAHQAAALTAKRLRTNIPSRKGRALPQSGTLYNNGPYNGTTDAWTINFGFSTSESFTGGGPVTGLHFVYWDASNNDLLTTVDISIGSTSFGGTLQTLSGVTNTFLGTNQYGYYLYQADYSFSGAGSGSYVTLSNACTTSGCSVSNPIYWDENSGVGCTSQGCPSTAYENTLGSIPSETFSLDGGGGPECVYDKPADYFKVIHSFMGQQDGASPAGVSVNKVGELYGTTDSAGSGAGTVFKLAQQGSDWLLNTLYDFAGGAAGSSPSPIIIGPYGRLYGGANGGIDNCLIGGYCGLVFSVQPAPYVCLNTPCSWTETTLYQFTGDTDAWGGGVSAFDAEGNLYGIGNGGSYGWDFGSVFELTPALGGWTEKILHNFTGGSDGFYPVSMLMGKDGNLYGTARSGGDLSCHPPYGCGVIFQLVPSGGGWTENVIYAFTDNGDGFSPTTLIQDSSGNLYGLSIHYYCNPYDCAYYGIAFELAYSSGNWQFNLLRDNDQYGTCNDYLNGLAIDGAGNLYASGGANDPNCTSPFYGYIVNVRAGQTLVTFNGNDFGNLTVDASGNLYGTTPGCGDYGVGTVWRLGQ